jgi:hypothetical protein
MSETTTIQAACPSCGKLLTRVTGSRAPHRGDVNVCAHCAGLSRFGVGLHLVPLTDDDLLELPAEMIDELNEARSLVLQFLRSSADV